MFAIRNNELLGPSATLVVVSRCLTSRNNVCY